MRDRLVVVLVVVGVVTAATTWWWESRFERELQRLLDDSRPVRARPVAR